MSRFSFDEVDNYGNSASGSFFVLRDDGDTARVRFLYEGIDDVEGYAVHQIEMPDGKKRYVNCLRQYNDPLEKCPFCEAHIPVKPKLFIKLYNEDEKECQIWERGKTYFQRIASLSARYNPLYDQIIEIERNGKKGDMKTEYVFYPTDKEPIDINDEAYECADPLGTIILDKTADEMYEYLDTGDFPASSEQVAEERSSGRRHEEPTGRRTPNSGRRAF